MESNIDWVALTRSLVKNTRPKHPITESPKVLTAQFREYIRKQRVEADREWNLRRLSDV